MICSKSVCLWVTSIDKERSTAFIVEHNAGFVCVVLWFCAVILYGITFVARAFFIVRPRRMLKGVTLCVAAYFFKLVPFVPAL